MPTGMKELSTIASLIDGVITLERCRQLVLYSKDWLLVIEVWLDQLPRRVREDYISFQYAGLISVFEGLTICCGVLTNTLMLIARRP
jgi:hypothetical protein